MPRVAAISRCVLWTVTALLVGYCWPREGATLYILSIGLMALGSWLFLQQIRILYAAICGPLRRTINSCLASLSSFYFLLASAFRLSRRAS